MVLSNLTKPVVPSGGPSHRQNLDARKQTTTGGNQTLISLPVAEGQIIDCEATVLYKVGTTKRGSLKVSGLFYRNPSGDVTLEGIDQQIKAHTSDMTVNVYLVADTTNQAIIVRGWSEIGQTIEWDPRLSYTVHAAS